MKSSRYYDGLSSLIHDDYSLAEARFKRMVDNAAIEDKFIKADILYNFAVSSLGSLLKKLAKAPQKIMYAIKEVKPSPNKPSFFDKLLIKIAGKSDTSSELKTEYCAVEQIEDELKKLLMLFNSAKMSMKPKSLAGIDFAINHFLKNLIRINQDEITDRSKAFSQELMKFRMLYTTKIYTTIELETAEEGYLFKIFMPKEMKQLRSIFDKNSNDALFLSYEQIDELHKMIKSHQENKTLVDVFNRLKERLCLTDISYKKNEYIDFIKTCKINLNVDNVILIHDLFNNRRSQKLLSILLYLHKYDLLSDNTYKNFMSLMTPAEDYRTHLKAIIEVILTCHSDDKNYILIELIDYISDKIPHLDIFKKACIENDTLNTKKLYIYLGVLDLLKDNDEESLLDLICNLMSESEVVNEFLIKDDQTHYPEKPLEEVIHDFLEKSDDVEFPIDEAEMKIITDRYMLIKNIDEELLVAGKQELQSALAKCKELLARDPNNQNAQLRLLAIIRIEVRNKLGIYPYNIQMMNVLALLNEPRRIGQIKTGEGKSTLIAMLAAYHGVLGHKIDIITTSHDLAMRDTNKYKIFYHALGLTSGHSVTKEEESNDWVNHHVVYGTVSDFEFAYLRGETQDKSTGRSNRPYDVVIADEVDSMFIDMQRNEAVLSRPNENAYEAEVYESIWQWVSDTKKENQTRENLQTMLKSIDVEVNHEMAERWLKSALTAQHYTPEKEYVIAYPDDNAKQYTQNDDQRIIKIVNKANTGEIEGDTTRWQGGLHEILEAKHNLRVRVESLTVASINHIEYFNKYKSLIGLTGTLGGTASRNELEQLFKVKMYDSPPYKRSKKKHIPDIIVENEKSQLTTVRNTVQQLIDTGRPVLVLCESIQDSRILAEKLAKNIKSIQIYNGLQTLSSAAILGLAGNPGAVTIATNLAGRGTDIITTPDAETHGGLHVIMTFPAINQRVEQQAFGRTGRQGKNGTYQYILSEKQLSDSEKKGQTTAEKIAIMRNNRQIREKIISTDNLYHYNIMHKVYILQHVFFSLPMQIKSKIMTEWAMLKTGMNKYIAQYVRDELENGTEIIATQYILEIFNDFWQKVVAQHGDHYKTPIDFIKLCLKKRTTDEHTKTLWLQSTLLFENPNTDFSSELTDMWLELIAPELLTNENISESKHSVINFHSTKIPEKSEIVENRAKHHAR